MGAMLTLKNMLNRFKSFIYLNCMRKQILKMLCFLVSCAAVNGLTGCTNMEIEQQLSYRRDSLNTIIRRCTLDVSGSQRLVDSMMRLMNDIEVRSVELADSTSLIGKAYPKEVAFIHFFDKDPIAILEEYLKKPDGEAAVWLLRQALLWNYGATHAVSVNEARRNLQALDSAKASLLIQNHRLELLIDHRKKEIIEKSTKCSRLNNELNKVINELEEF